MRNHAFKISISKGFRKCAFSFIERVGISGGSCPQENECKLLHILPGN